MNLEELEDAVRLHDLVKPAPHLKTRVMEAAREEVRRGRGAMAARTLALAAALLIVASMTATWVLEQSIHEILGVQPGQAHDEASPLRWTALYGQWAERGPSAELGLPLLDRVEPQREPEATPNSEPRPSRSSTQGRQNTTQQGVLRHV